MSLPAVRGCSFLNNKANAPRLGFRRRHELANRVKHHLKLGVIFLFQARGFGVGVDLGSSLNLDFILRSGN